MVSVAGSTVRVNCFEAVALAESVTVTVKAQMPLCVGVPLRTPAEVKARPGGNAAAVTDQVYGLTPSVAVKVREYDTPTVPLGSGDAVVIESGAGLMVIANGPEVALTEYRSVTRTVNDDVPAAVGVPEIRPFALSRLRLCGSWPVARDQT